MNDSRVSLSPILSPQAEAGLPSLPAMYSPPVDLGIGREFSNYHSGQILALIVQITYPKIDPHHPTTKTKTALKILLALLVDLSVHQIFTLSNAHAYQPTSNALVEGTNDGGPPTRSQGL